jgi:hypothetical protein
VNHVILNLDTYRFSSTYAAVRNIANKLLIVYSVGHVSVY